MPLSIPKIFPSSFPCFSTDRSYNSSIFGLALKVATAVILSFTLISVIVHYKRKRSSQSLPPRLPPRFSGRHGRNLTEAVKKSDNDLEMTSREKRICPAICALLAEKSLILSGDVGTGRHTVVELIAKHHSIEIIELDMSEISANAILRGQAEGRMKHLLNEIEQRKAILYFHDFEEVLIEHGNFGSSNEKREVSSFSVTRTLLPYLQRNAFRCIARASKDLSGYPSELLSFFQTIQVAERTDSEVAEVLFQRYKLEADSLTQFINYSCRYISPSCRLKKYIDIFDTCTGEREKDYIRALREVCHIPLPTKKKQRSSLLNLEKKLKKRILGQENALYHVSSACRRYLTGLNDPGKPIGVFLFVGPTGTGKTELTLTLANTLFNDNYVRLNMVDFQGAIYTKVIKETLAQALISQPFSVVLIDEADRTNAQTLEFFMTVFDAGYFTDSYGRHVDCRHAIFIMTSNFKADSFSYQDRNLQKKIEEEARNYFAPEFIARINQIVLFHPLSKENIGTLICKELEKFQEELRLSHHQFHLHYEESTIPYFIKHYIPEEGARSIQKPLNEVRDLISIHLLEGKGLKNLYLSVVNEQLTLSTHSSFPLLTTGMAS